jgi:hypothetical protein
MLPIPLPATPRESRYHRARHPMFDEMTREEWMTWSSATSSTIGGSSGRFDFLRERPPSSGSIVLSLSYRLPQCPVIWIESTAPVARSLAS